MRYFIELSYFGKHYHGWQRQPNAITVQETIEKALSTLLRKPVSIMGAGRTDTGVHALQMYAHFDWDDEDGITEYSLEQLTYKLNNFLPVDIAIATIFEVPEEAHTRFDAINRSYIYKISKHKNVFTSDHAYCFKYDLDVKAMNEAAQLLLTYNDFECFSKSNTDVRTYLCNIEEACWTEEDNELRFHITANRFLRNMVRAIVGTLLEIGQHKKPVSWMHDVIKTKNRSQAGSSVPGHGLYLSKITYPKDIIQ